MAKLPLLFDVYRTLPSASASAVHRRECKNETYEANLSVLKLQAIDQLTFARPCASKS
jgi:hypothetical protein